MKNIANKIKWVALLAGLVIPGVSSASSASAVSAPRIALRNYLELQKAFEQTTGVLPNELFNYKTYFDEAKSQIPEDGKIENLSPPLLLTITKIGYLYCYRFLLKESQLTGDRLTLRKAHQMVDFTKKRADLTDDILKDVFSNYAKLFWRRNLTDAEFSQMKKSFADAMSSLPETADEIQRGMTASCTAALTSLEVIAL